MTTGTCPTCGAAYDAPAGSRQVCLYCGGAFDVAAEPGAGPGAVPVETLTPVAAAEAAAPPASTRCTTHPNNPAQRTCNRCGDFICEVCETRAEGRVYCVPCYDHRRDRGELRSSQGAFSLPTWSLTLGIIAFPAFCLYCAGIPVGITAIVLGFMSLAEIRRRPSLPGRGKAVAGIVLGFLVQLLAVGYIVMIAVMMASERRR